MNLAQIRMMLSSWQLCHSFLIMKTLLKHCWTLIQESGCPSKIWCHGKPSYPVCHDMTELILEHFQMFLLVRSRHDPPIEATDAGAIGPTDVSLHRQRSIVPHPPKGLKHLKGQTVSNEMVLGCQLYLSAWGGMAVLRALKPSCYCWLVFYVHAVCSPNSLILGVASCYCIQSNLIWYVLCGTIVFHTTCKMFL